MSLSQFGQCAVVGNGIPWETAKNIFFRNAIAVILFMEIEARRTTAGRGKERASIARQEAVTTRECAKELFN